MKMVVSTSVVNTRSEWLLSFSLTKKNPALAGEEDGQMIGLTDLFFHGKTYQDQSLETGDPLGGTVLGNRSIVQ